MMAYACNYGLHDAEHCGRESRLPGPCAVRSVSVSPGATEVADAKLLAACIDCPKRYLSRPYVAM